MASVTGDLKIDFSLLADVNPYVDSSLDFVGSFRVLSGSLRGLADDIFISNAVVTDANALESKIMMNANHPSGDPHGPALINAAGNGYYLRCTYSESRIYTVVANVIGARIGAAINGAPVAGDDVSLRINESAGLITSFLNGVQLEQITNNTYKNLSAGYVYNFQNNRTAGINEWAADGYASGGDVAAPVITMLGSSPVNLTIGDAYSDAGATALDDTDGVITGNIVTVNPVNTAVAGTYTVTYNVDDAAGNSAVEVTRSVVVAAALMESASFPVSGANATGLTYKVFDSQNLATANQIASGTTAAIVSNTVTIDLAGVATIGDNVLLVLTDFTITPSETSQAAVGYTTVVGV